MADSLLSSPESKFGSGEKKPSKIRFAPGVKGGTNTQTNTKYGKTAKPEKKWNRPILSDEHEQTQKFSSATGENFTQTKKFEKE